MTELTPRAGRRAINWALLVLTLVLLLTGLMTWFVNRLVEQRERVRFEREVDALSLAIDQRLTGYVAVLRATRGLWSIEEDVGRVEFARYVDTLELPRLYPGIQGLGFAAYVPREALERFEQRVQGEGLPEFRVWPDGPRDYYVPVTYLEPQDEANAYATGFDMASEPVRREAIERAVREGDVAASAPVQLVQEDRKAQRQVGFLMYLPVYRQGASIRTAPERRSALLGFVYAPFRTGDLLEGLDAAQQGTLDLTISSAGQIMFGEPQPDARFRESRELQLAGQVWTLEFGSEGFGDGGLELSPWLTLLAGLVVGLTAFHVLRMQVLGRERAEEMNDRLARSRSSLDKARAEFEAIFRAMQDAAVFTDEQGRVRLGNDAMQRTFGYAPEEWRELNLSNLHVAQDLPAEGDYSLLTARYRRKDGSLFTGESQRSYVRNEGGEVIGQLEVVRDLTERLETERALRDIEVRYRGVLEALPLMVWVTDTRGRFLYFNSGWYAFTGESMEDSREIGFERALHPEDAPRTLERWERSWRHGEAFEVLYRFRRYDGEYRWFVGRASPIHDADGAIVEWVGTSTDIHERVEFEGQLRRSEARYRGLVEGMPHIVWLADPQGHTTYFNRRWEAFAGPLPPDGSPHAAVHPEDRELFARRWRQSVETGEPFEQELRLRHVTGEYRAFAARSLPVRGDDGEVIEWVGTLTDVQDQVNAEASARLLVEVSRVLATPLGEVRDVTGVLRLLTRQFTASASLWLADGLELFSAHELGGQVAESALPGLESQLEAHVRGALHTAQARAVPAEGELRRSGLQRILIVPLIARAEAPFGALVLGCAGEPDDLTHHLAGEVAARLATAIDNQRLYLQTREAEREIKELNQTLEARVESRTRELQEANRELEAFSYSVSHDLRTPLRHIVGFGDLLRRDMEDQLGEKGQRYLGIITQAATRMSALIDDLLSFSRMGRQEMRLVDVDLNRVIGEARAELGPTAAPVEWRVAGLPVVPGDPNLLKLVFINLLSNALKYSRTRERPVVEVTSRVVDGEAVVAVSDNGVGFDSRFADKLFGVFQRLHRSEEFEGTGIGLANVRRIVHRHGGRVWAESRLGEGATFYLALPLQHQPGTPQETA